jgi:hypothetical protein
MTINHIADVFLPIDIEHVRDDQFIMLIGPFLLGIMNLAEQRRRSELVRSKITHIATQGKTDIQSNHGHEKIPDNEIQFTPPTSTTEDSSEVL